MRPEFPDAKDVNEAISESILHGRFGYWPRVLCVCSAAVMRSPTIAWVLSHAPYDCNTKSAGSHAHKALIPVSQSLLDWSEKVVFANKENYERVRDAGFKMPAEIYILELVDGFVYREPELIKAIHDQLIEAKFKG